MPLRRRDDTVTFFFFACYWSKGSRFGEPEFRTCSVVHYQPDRHALPGDQSRARDPSGPASADTTITDDALMLVTPADLEISCYGYCVFQAVVSRCGRLKYAPESPGLGRTAFGVNSCSRSPCASSVVSPSTRGADLVACCRSWSVPCEIPAYGL